MKYHIFMGNGIKIVDEIMVILKYLFEWSFDRLT